MIETKVTELLGQLAEKLGVASAKIWEWSLLQVRVDIVSTIIMVICAVLASVAVFKAIKKVIKMWEKASYSNEGLPTIFTIALICAGIAVFSLDCVAFDKLINLPKLLINPEYAAFENIVKQLGSLK